MGKWVAVGGESMLADGAMAEVQVEGEAVLVARVGGRYYATQGKCPHMGSKLANGKLEGKVITCKWHHSQFDLADGRNIVWAPALPAVGRAVTDLWTQARPLRVYPTKVENAQVWVELG